MSLTRINMFTLILVPFLAQNAFAKGVGNVDCERGPYTICSPGIGRQNFPENEADLNAACPDILKYAECLNNYDEMCATGEDFREFKPGQYVRIRELLEDICNNNSILHKVLAENIRCIKETVGNVDAVCTPKLSLLRKAYIVDEEFESMEELVKFQCLFTYQIMSCAAGDISRRCGDRTKSAVREIMFQSNLLKTDQCPPEQSSGMIKIVTDLEIPDEQKEELLDFIFSYNAWTSERK